MEKINDIEQDIYFNILKWAYEKWNFTKDEIIKVFPNEKEIILKELSNSKIFNSIEVWWEKYFLSFDDRFKLLQFQALKEAREDSKKAKTYAIIAMCITSFIWILQILISFLNNNS